MKEEEREKINLTDRDANHMKTGGSKDIRRGYNCQAFYLTIKLNTLESPHKSIILNFTKRWKSGRWVYNIYRRLQAYERSRIT